MKNKFILILLLSTLSVTSSCSYINGSSTSDSKEDFIQGNYSYTYTSKLSNSIDILDYSYGELSYNGYETTKGMQLGSKNNPIKDFHIQINLNEYVTIKSIGLELSMGSNGTGQVSCEVSDYTSDVKTFSNNTPKSYEFTNIDKYTDKFTIILNSTNQGAVYLKSLNLDLLISSTNSKFNTGSITDPSLPTDPDFSTTSSSSSISSGEIIVNSLLGESMVSVSLPHRYEPIIKEQYYTTFNLNLTGDSLRRELNTKNAVKTEFSYGDSRYALGYLDEDPNNLGHIYSIYDGENYESKWDSGSTWNREHVWACSHMVLDGANRPENETKNQMSDFHNLRANSTDVNSKRGNLFFKKVDGNIDSNYFYPNTSESGGDHRGDVARILFYMYVTYSELFLVNNPSSYTDKSKIMGHLDDLIKWNKEDPVDEFELQRNNRIYIFQGNRNPFIDYPELVDKLF